jgi:hypothetical protein
VFAIAELSTIILGPPLERDIRGAGALRRHCSMCSALLALPGVSASARLVVDAAGLRMGSRSSHPNSSESLPSGATGGVVPCDQRGHDCLYPTESRAPQSGTRDEPANLDAIVSRSGAGLSTPILSRRSVWIDGSVPIGSASSFCTASAQPARGRHEGVITKRWLSTTSSTSSSRPHVLDHRRGRTGSLHGYPASTS